MKKPDLSTRIETWKSYLGLTPEEICARLGLKSLKINHEERYGNLSGMDELWKTGKTPGHFYFAHGGCALIYIEDVGGELDDIQLKDLQALLGEAESSLGSRAGKTNHTYVYPDQGLAFSASRSAVDYLEIFSPTTLEDYQSRYYTKPSPFVR